MRLIVGSMSLSLSTRTSTCTTFSPPSITRVMIGSGMKTRLSRFSSASDPRRSCTPTTSNWRLPTRTICPTGFSPGNRFALATRPSTITLAPERNIGGADQSTPPRPLVLDGRIRVGNPLEPRDRLLRSGRDGEALDRLVGATVLRAARRSRRRPGRDRSIGRRLTRADADELAVDLDHVAAQSADAVGDLLAHLHSLP